MIVLKTVKRCRKRWTSWNARADSGTVTAEFAVILPAFIVMAALLLAMAQVARVGMGCQDAARAVAREVVLARSDADPTALARRVAGRGVQVDVEEGGGQVRVKVACPVLKGPFGILPPRVFGQAVAVLEESGEGSA